MALYTCTKCGKKVPWEYEVCPYCQTPRPVVKEQPIDISKMKQCRDCGKLIEKSAKICPKCGAKQKKKHFILWAIVAVLCISVVGAAIGSLNDKPERPEDSSVVQSDKSKGNPQISDDNSKEDKSAYEITYQNARTWVDSIGTTWVQVIVEISNTGSKNLYLGSGAYDLEDENGALVASKTMVSAFPSVLAPGEKGYMYEETTLDNFGGGALTVLPRPDVSEAKVDLVRYALSDISISNGQYGGVSVLGRIENTTSEDTDGMVYISGFFYDANGTPIGSAFTILTDTIAAGDKIGFELSGFSLPDDVTVDIIADSIFYAYPLQYQF